MAKAITPKRGSPAASRSRARPVSSSRRSGVVPLHFSRDTIQIGEEAPLVHADQVELVAESRRLSGWNNKLRKGGAEAVSFQETIERYALVRAQGEGGGLGYDARIQRRWLEHAGERLSHRGPGKQCPGGHRGFAPQYPFEIFYQQCELR